MSDAQKAVLSRLAYSKTRSDYERHARRLLESTNCPLVMVYASSGGPSTESSILCLFNSGAVLAGRTPHCEARFPGQVDHCPLLKLLVRKFYQAKLLGDAVTMKEVATRLRVLREFHLGREDFINVVEGGIGWRKINGC